MGFSIISTSFSLSCELDLCATKRKHIEILRQTNRQCLAGMEADKLSCSVTHLAHCALTHCDYRREIF